jgi:hypothetical protein
MQTVGAYSLYSTGPKDPRDNETAWEEARTALEPLIDWSHHVKSVKPTQMARMSNVNSVCVKLTAGKVALSVTSPAHPGPGGAEFVAYFNDRGN